MRWWRWRRLRPAGWLRARHLSGRRPADLPGADRHRGDRHTGCGHGIYAQPWPRALAPKPRLLLPARRRADVRHGAILPDRADDAAWSGAAGDRVGADLIPRAYSHQPAAAWHDYQGRDGHPCRRCARFCERPGRDARDELRRVARRAAEDRDLWLARHTQPARSQHVRWAGAPAAAERQRMARDIDRARLY